MQLCRNVLCPGERAVEGWAPAAVSVTFVSAGLNTAAVDVDPVDGTVRLDGRVLAVDPVGDVPLSRRYFLR